MWTSDDESWKALDRKFSTSPGLVVTFRINPQGIRTAGSARGMEILLRQRTFSEEDADINRHRQRSYDEGLHRRRIKASVRMVSNLELYAQCRRHNTGLIPKNKGFRRGIYVMEP